MNKIVPVLTVLAVLIVIWYAAAVKMNSTWTFDQAERAGTEVSFSELVKDTMSQTRPLLPAPHQIATELWKTTVEKKITSKRSMIYQGSITLKTTLLGFGFGIVIGIALATVIVLSRVGRLTLMPWAIISQTIPIVALAPIIVVLSNAAGTGTLMVPKAIIAAYLSFYPVLVSMVKGLSSPDQMQLDLLKTYGASQRDVFWKLRLPSSMPYFFASLKVSVAAAFVGAVVAELSTSAIAGLGARMLIGSQFGEPMIMWAALFAAAILAAILIFLVGGFEKLARYMMGGRAV
ncbi:ABC transporter permease [Celeribacter halophilus]|jgi:NitT/TauT family transport system permease protein|uniref:ABC transporter permease subunit n=1 Tax=Celeribacter halophilus TaxID=576117 RepID=A0AAW7XSU4_9RHOB|nr:ABC transporter permease subunit [Celeribacter halophilus]MBU2888689.1 ABC transporter permease subunit [Celeribacter halophilus]MDO6457423.1 ABC transporter permease subunit [Celeribacter halophilus]MDO6508956.1 ABC transporter permease subunit [Celeribacter halophilus]MDO6722124.1 ABC transporter permease subunit [Celeribacter halophilus]